MVTDLRIAVLRSLGQTLLDNEPERLTVSQVKPQSSCVRSNDKLGYFGLLKST